MQCHLPLLNSPDGFFPEFPLWEGGGIQCVLRNPSHLAGRAK